MLPPWNKKSVVEQGQLFVRRSMLMLAVALIILTVIIVHALKLSVINQLHYAYLADKNQLSYVSIEPKRGMIYDRDGQLLAGHRAITRLVWHPSPSVDVEAMLKALEELISLDNATLDRIREQCRHSDDVLIKHDLHDPELSKLMVHLHQFPGLDIRMDTERYYPDGINYASIIGYVDSVDHSHLPDELKFEYQAADALIGKSGIEKYYETLLRGQSGYEIKQQNAQRRTLGVIASQPATNGDNIYLTISSKLQKTARAAFGNTSGAAVAIDPQNGEILLLYSAPSFDNNAFISKSPQGLSTIFSHPDNPLFNRAISGQYSPGSVIKPFTALYALEHELITESFIVSDPGWFIPEHSQHLFHDWKRDGHGDIGVREALIVSCDTFFYKIGEMMGIKHLFQALDTFHLGHRTNIDLHHEAQGLIPNPTWKENQLHQPWYIGDTILSSIGQGNVLTTPIQLAFATAILANHGQGYQPHLIKTLLDHQHHIVHSAPSLIVDIQFSAHFLKLIEEAMQGVIDSVEPHGTGFRFGAHPGYTVAGKTGTAQVVAINHVKQKDKQQHLMDNGLFIAYAPVEHPLIAISVISEHNNHSTVIAKKIIDCYLKDQCLDLEKKG